MTVREIKKFPDPVLRERAAEVLEFNEDLRVLLDDMAETMYAAPGIGLAANQVGVLQRVAVIDVSENHSERINLVNPRIVHTEGTRPSEEGCLSIPGYHDSIKRWETVVVQAQDETGKEFEIKGTGLLAACLQHELDHLDGILFIDHLSRLKRELFRRWLRKQNSE